MSLCFRSVISVLRWTLLVAWISCNVRKYNKINPFLFYSIIIVFIIIIFIIIVISIIMIVIITGYYYCYYYKLNVRLSWLLHI